MHGLTQVTFDGSSPKELLQIVNDVMVYLDDKTHPASLRDEPIEITIHRMTGFLRLLKLKVPGGDMYVLLCVVVFFSLTQNSTKTLADISNALHHFI